MKMKFFSRQEIIGIAIILAVIFGVTWYNFQLGYRRARNVERKSNMSTLHRALTNYQDDFGIFPLSSEQGGIVACLPPGVNPEEAEELFPCQWGKDALEDVTDPDYPDYLPRIPPDPEDLGGARYLYLSTGRHFQVFSALEEPDEEINPEIVKRNLRCGNRICNYGKADGRTPLDKSLEEYENEIAADEKK